MLYKTLRLNREITNSSEHVQQRLHNVFVSRSNSNKEIEYIFTYIQLVHIYN